MMQLLDDVCLRKMSTANRKLFPENKSLVEKKDAHNSNEHEQSKKEPGANNPDQTLKDFKHASFFLINI